MRKYIMGANVQPYSMVADDMHDGIEQQERTGTMHKEKLKQNTLHTV